MKCEFAEGIYAGAPLKLLHEPDLLETGGGIKNAKTSLRREPFIVYSGDILTDIDLQPLIDEHFAKGNDVTLALRDTGLAAAGESAETCPRSLKLSFSVPEWDCACDR